MARGGGGGALTAPLVGSVLQVKGGVKMLFLVNCMSGDNGGTLEVAWVVSVCAATLLVLKLRQV